MHKKEVVWWIIEKECNFSFAIIYNNGIMVFGIVLMVCSSWRCKLCQNPAQQLKLWFDYLKI